MRDKTNKEIIDFTDKMRLLFMDLGYHINGLETMQNNKNVNFVYIATENIKETVAKMAFLFVQFDESENNMKAADLIGVDAGIFQRIISEQGGANHDSESR